MREVNHGIGRIAVALNPLLGVIIAICGSIAGAVMANSPAGGIVGLVGGTALALALCGNLAMMSVVAERTRFSPTVIPLPRQQSTQTTAVPPAVNKPEKISQDINATTTGKTEKMSDDVTMTESEGELLAAGRFSDYHLAKAKRLFASGNLKEAIYQAGACLSHNPHNAEARALRKQAQEKQRT